MIGDISIDNFIDYFRSPDRKKYLERKFSISTPGGRNGLLVKSHDVKLGLMHMIFGGKTDGKWDKLRPFGRNFSKTKHLEFGTLVKDLDYPNIV